MVESFPGSPKRGQINRVRYRTCEQARADVFDYIEVLYHRYRPIRALLFNTAETLGISLPFANVHTLDGLIMDRLLLVRRILEDGLRPVEAAQP